MRGGKGLGNQDAGEWELSKRFFLTTKQQKGRMSFCRGLEASESHAFMMALVMMGGRVPRSIGEERERKTLLSHRNQPISKQPK